MLDGEIVVDLWAGDADLGTRRWTRDTIVNVWSVTKTMSAIVLLLLVDRGDVDLDVPVARYWPEFKINGKEGVLVRHVLAHSAALPGWDVTVRVPELADWERCCALLASQPPWWSPGSVSGYHALTQGFLVGEIVRRVTGQSIGSFFAKEIAEPLGADFHIGLPESEESRVASVEPPGQTLAEVATSQRPGATENSIASRALRSCPLTGKEPNERWWRAAEIPAAGGMGNARSVARVHAALACDGELNGMRLLSPATLDCILREQTFGTDLVLGMPMRYGVGFGLMSESTPLSPNDRAFFWGGWGGAMAIIDRDERLSVSYVMNRMWSGADTDFRGVGLIFATYAALAGGARNN